MRALTLTQPWSGLVAAGVKRVENRPRPMIRREQIGEQFAIHASREVSKEAIRRIVEISPDLMNPERDWMRLCHVTSAILAVTTLQDIWLVGGCSRETIEEMCAKAGMPDQARFVFGPVVYVLRDTVALNVAIPCRGWQGFWSMEPQLEAQVRAQIPGSGAP